MFLITELNDEVAVEVIKESKEGSDKKNYFIEGIIMQGGIKNRNGRVYPKDTLMQETARYNTEFVNKNRAYGELGHPQGPTINLDRVSHMFTELKEDGSNVVGRAKIMDTPMGKIVKNFIDEGAYLGISSRGMGTLKKNSQGIMEVQGDFRLATPGDLVADPSAPDAFVNGIMEGVSFYHDIASGNWISENQLDEIEEEIKETAHESSKLLEEKASRLYHKFLTSLAK